MENTLGNEAQVVDAIRNSGAEFVFSRGHGLTRSERRRGRNQHAMRWAIGHYDNIIWTPAQQQAVLLFYELGMPSARAARVVGISRQAFNARLTAAEKSARRWYESDRRPRYREKKGRPDAQLEVSGRNQIVTKKVPWLGEPDDTETFQPA